MEESKFINELEEVTERRKFMEQRYKKIKKIPPSQVRVHLAWKKGMSAVKIQNWWRKLQTKSGMLEEVEDNNKHNKLSNCP